MLYPSKIFGSHDCHGDLHLKVMMRTNCSLFFLEMNCEADKQRTIHLTKGFSQIAILHS